MKFHLPIFLLGVVLAAGAAAADRDEYNLKAATDDLAVFHKHARDGALARADVQSDVNFSPRFDAIDANRDGYVTASEMHAYIAQTYGIVASGSRAGSTGSSTGAGRR
jgi:hypothetical protein